MILGASKFGFSSGEDPFNSNPECNDYVCHGAELPFVFHSMEFLNYTWTTQTERVSWNTLFYWASFVHGDLPVIPPNSTGLPTWPSFNPNSPQFLNITLNPFIMGDFNQYNCDMFDSFGYII